ncbi:hypothetical protein ACVWW4_003502 [Bradyrhizobium sp. LB7.1]
MPASVQRWRTELVEAPPHVVQRPANFPGITHRSCECGGRWRIPLAEARSAVTCEFCGEPGLLYGHCGSPRVARAHNDGRCPRQCAVWRRLSSGSVRGRMPPSVAAQPLRPPDQQLRRRRSVRDLGGVSHGQRRRRRRARPASFRSWVRERAPAQAVARPRRHVFRKLRPRHGHADRGAAALADEGGLT